MKPVIGILVLGIGALMVFFLLDGTGLAPDESDPTPRASDRPVPVGTSNTDKLPASQAPIATVPFDKEPAREEATGMVVLVRVLEESTRKPVGGAQVSICDSSVYFETVRRGNHIHGSPASRVIMGQLSKTTVTNAEGLAHLGLPGRRFWIEARSGDLWGWKMLTSPPEGTVEILLAKELQLRVKVVSPEGNGLPGVPIALRLKRPNQRRYTQKITMTEPPQGIGRFDHIQRRFKQGKGWHATFAFPLRDAPVIPIVEGNLPTRPLELALPGAGSLEISIRDDTGKPVGGDQISLSVAAYPDAAVSEPIWPGGPWSLPRLDARGKARLPWIGLGLHLVVSAKPSDRDSERKPVTVAVAGPVANGETATCEFIVKAELTASERFPTVTGRFVRRDGTPWPPVVVRAQLRLFPFEIGYTPSEKITLGVDGRFRILVRRDCPEGGTRKYHLTAEPEKPEPVMGWLDLSRELPPGATDVGDVLLDHGPLLVAGRIVDQEGRPIAKAGYSVTTLVMKNDREYWPGVRVSGPHFSAADGSYALYAVNGEELPSGRMRFRARHRGHISGSPLEFTIGTRNLVFELRQAGALSGSVHLSEGQTAGDIRIALAGAETKLGVNVKEDGTFHKDGLTPGTFTLTATLRAAADDAAEAPKLVIEGIEVLPGTTNRDARIQDMRLTGKTTKVELEIVDEASSPIRRARVDLLPRTQLTRQLTDASGKVTIYVKSLPVALNVTAFGYRRAHLADVRGNRRVILKRGIPIKVVTDAKAVGESPQFRLGLSILHIDDKTGSSEYILSRITPPGGTFFNDRGELSLRVPKPGTYSLRPLVVVLDLMATGGGVGMKSVPRITVRDSKDLQTFRIDIPQDLLLKAVQRYSK